MNLHWARAFQQLMPSLIQGVGVVLYVTALGFIGALIMALLLAIGRVSKNKILNRILIVFIEFIRGTPLLVQFFYIYYVIPMLIDGIAAVFGMEIDVQFSATFSGIVGFTINYGCYMSEVIRSAILSVDPGQREAGLALGFSETQVLFKFIIPPAVRNSIPVFGNYLVMMIKDTSLLAMISVQELLLRAKTFASQTFMTVEAYTIVALVYLILSVPLSRLAVALERHLKRARLKQKEIKG